ncbi:MAG: glycosyltransferase family 39 protein [Planctomycetota bacterium]
MGEGEETAASPRMPDASFGPPRGTGRRSFVAQLLLLALSMSSSIVYYAIRSTDLAGRIMRALGHRAHRQERAPWPPEVFVLWALLFCVIPIICALIVRGRPASAPARRPRWILFFAAAAFLAGFVYVTETMYLTFPAAQNGMYLIWSNHFAEMREAPALHVDGKKIINGDEDEVRNLVVTDIIARHGLGGFVDAWKDVPTTSSVRSYLLWGTSQHPPLYFLALAPGAQLAGVRAARWTQLVVACIFLAAVAGAIRAYKLSAPMPSALLLLAMPGLVVYELSKASSDAFVAIWVTLAVWCLADLRGAKGLARAALAGAFLGAGLWSKYTALISVGAATLLVLFGLRGLRARNRVAAAAIMLACAAAVAAPLVLWLWDTPTGVAQWKHTLEPIFQRAFSRMTHTGRVYAARSSVGVSLRNLGPMLLVEWGVPFSLAAAAGVFSVLRDIARSPERRRCLAGPVIFLSATWAATLIQNPLWRYTMPAMWALVAVVSIGITDVFRHRALRAAFVAHLVLFALTKVAAYVVEYVPTA